MRTRNEAMYRLTYIVRTHFEITLKAGYHFVTFNLFIFDDASLSHKENILLFFFLLELFKINFQLIKLLNYSLISKKIIL